MRGFPDYAEGRQLFAKIMRAHSGEVIAEKSAGENA